MDAKQYVTEPPMDHWRNQRGNFKKKPTDKWKVEHNHPKPMGCSKSSSKREDYSNTILPHKTRQITNEQPNLTPKAIWEKNKQNPK